MLTKSAFIIPGKDTALTSRTPPSTSMNTVVVEDESSVIVTEMRLLRDDIISAV